MAKLFAMIAALSMLAQPVWAGNCYSRNRSYSYRPHYRQQVKFFYLPLYQVGGQVRQEAIVADMARQLTPILRAEIQQQMQLQFQGGGQIQGQFTVGGQATVGGGGVIGGGAVVPQPIPQPYPQQPYPQPPGQQPAQPLPPQQPEPPPQANPNDQGAQEILNRHCIRCHKGETAERGVDLSDVTALTPWARGRVELLTRTGIMPKDGAKVSQEEATFLETWVLNRPE